ncbi:MAG: hypothetical protein JXA53_01710 [Bacteroidales bacterium]|nr:hypothetical protein [Bacteroidales bacterium]
MRKFIIFCFLLFVIPFSAFSQKRVAVKVINVDSVNFNFNIRNNYSDSASFVNHLKKSIYKAKKRGFISASVDSVDFKSDTIKVWLFSGNKYVWSSVDLNMLGVKLQLSEYIPTKNRIVNWPDFELYLDKSLNYYSNNGYPFVSVSTDSVVVNSNSLKLSVIINSGPKIVYDNLIVKGSLRVNNKYLSKVLNIKPKNNYVHSDVQKIDKRLQSLSFVKQIKESELEFNGDKCTNYLYLDKRRVNNFSGILGLNSDKGKAKLTGEVLLDIKNIFKNGESFLFNWQSLANATQSLKTQFNSPYLLWDFGVGVDFAFYKRDTSFVDVNPQFYLQFNLSATDNLKLIYSYRKSYNVGQLAKVSGSNSITKNLYGLSFSRNMYNPYSLSSPGYKANLSALAGNRLTYQSNSDSKKYYFQFDYSFKSKVLFSKKFDMIFSSIGGYMYVADDNLSSINQNEVYRVGGVKNLRGYNDDEFYTPLFSTLSIEPGFIVGDDFRLFSFFDLGLVADMSCKSLTDPKYGSGLGFQWFMNRGIVKMSYSVGWYKNNPISFQRAKVNVSYVALF